MPRPDLVSLRRELLRSGVSPRHVHRALTELDEHFDDLVDAGLHDGQDRPAAEYIALDALGDLAGVAEAMRDQPALKSWAWRYPHVARVIYPLACVAALPAVPVIAGMQHASLVFRWAACVLIGGFVTAFMFLVLQLSIMPG